MQGLFADFKDFTTGRGGNAHTWSYPDDFVTTTFDVTSTGGHDIIYDQWTGTPEGGAADKLRFVGMTADEWDGLVSSGKLTGSTGDYNADGRSDLKLSWAGGSITIAGTDVVTFATLDQLKPYIIFDI